MEVIRRISRISACSRALKERGCAIGFVPTMGCLHEGHLSLIRQVKKDCDAVVISIFVNPTQFAPEGEDYKRYPRDIDKDCLLAFNAGVDFIFAPLTGEVYPDGYQTSINVEKLSFPLCGISRPGHFRGVATIVAKLFNIISPDIAYFGAKDAQQALIVKRMVADLNMEVEIKVLPTVRTADGLAVSSRNSYLTKEERKSAVVLYKSLLKARHLINSGERNSKQILKIMEEIVRKEPRVKIDYISLVDGETLRERKEISGKILIALAVWIGDTRLIDNISIEV
ncbi:MAG: Pantothenate synthetase [Syntrophomonadaceae bacterium]|nr:Pantothenate synthetase [Bacillota bacterium]